MISVIVPVYNVSQYLVGCLNSLAQQKDNNYEIILIDDGSTDNSYNICEEFCREHANFLLLHKSNGGVSSARNLGIKKSHGRFVCFVDSDDCVGPNYISDLRREMNGDVDFVLSKFHFVDGDITTTPISVQKVGKVDILFEKDSIISCQAPYGKLFKRDIIIDKSIFFDENVSYGEDRLFVYSYLLSINNVAISPNINYYYIRRPGSLTSRIYSVETEYYAYRESKRIIDALVDKLEIFDCSKLINLYAEVCDYGNRVINSIYHTRSFSRNERLAKLNLINMDFHSKYLRADTLKERFLRLLLRCRFYSMYDLIRVVKERIN